MAPIERIAAPLFTVIASLLCGCSDDLDSKQDATFSDVAVMGDQTPLPPHDGVLFFSDWRTGIGSSRRALLDGGKWSSTDGSSRIEVISAAGLGFPSGMKNVLRSEQDGHDYNYVQGHSILPAPRAGEHRYYRWYERWDDVVSSGFDHGIELSIGDGAYAFAQMSSPRSSGVRLAFQVANADIGGGPNIWYDLGGNFYGGSSSAKYLQRQRVYRIELHVHFPTSNSVQMLEIRVYDQSDALVWDNDDFEVAEPQYGVGKTLATHKPVSSLPSGGGSLWRNFHFGSNGQSGWPSNAGYRYYGGFRVSSEGWNGPYTQHGG